MNCPPLQFPDITRKAPFCFKNDWPSFPGNMYGVDGNRSRCSAFWDDLMSCVEQAGRNDQWQKCQNEREGYFECLHHKKLYTRLEKIQKQKEKLIRAGKWPPKEETPATQ